MKSPVLFNHLDPNAFKHTFKKTPFFSQLRYLILSFILGLTQISLALPSKNAGPKLIFPNSLQIQLTPSALEKIGNQINFFADSFGLSIESNHFDTFYFDSKSALYMAPDIKLVLNQVFKMLAQGMLNVVSQDQMNVTLKSEDISYKTKIKSLKLSLDPTNGYSSQSARFIISLSLSHFQANVKNTNALFSISTHDKTTITDTLKAKLSNIQVLIQNQIDFSLKADLEVINGKWSLRVGDILNNLSTQPFQINIGTGVELTYKGTKSSPIINGIINWVTKNLPTEIAQRLNQIEFNLEKEKLIVNSPLAPKEDKLAIAKNPLEVLIGVNFSKIFQSPDRFCINTSAYIQEKDLPYLQKMPTSYPSLFSKCEAPIGTDQPVMINPLQNADIVARIHSSVLESAVQLLFTKGHLKTFVLFDGTRIKLTAAPTLGQSITFNPKNNPTGTLGFTAVMGAGITAIKEPPTKDDFKCSVRNAFRSSDKNAQSNDGFGVETCQDYKDAQTGDFTKPAFNVAERIVFNGPVQLTANLDGQIALDKNRNIVVIVKGVDESSIEVDLSTLIRPLRSFEFTKNIVKKIIKWQIEQIVSEFSKREVELFDGSKTQGAVLIDKLPLPDALLNAPGDILGFSTSANGFVNVFINLEKSSFSTSDRTKP